MTLFTLGVYAVCASALVGRSGAAAYTLAGLGAAMALNAFIPHLVATIRFRRYAPGTATGLLLDLSAGVALVISLEAAGWIDPAASGWVVPLIVAATAAFTAALLWLVAKFRSGFGG